MKPFAADQCYACGRGAPQVTFNPDWRCRCGAPLCSVCWSQNVRICADHQETVMIPPQELAHSLPSRSSALSPAHDDQHTGLALQTAKQLENKFIEAFLRALPKIERVKSPLDGREYHPDPQVIPLETDCMGRLKALLEKHKIFDKQVLLNAPVGRCIQFPITYKNFLGKSTVKVYLIALSIIPLQECLMLKRLLSPCNAQRYQQELSSLTEDKKAFYAIGVFSPTGWQADLRRIPLNGPNWMATLVTAQEAKGWTLQHNHHPFWQQLAWIYNPETPQEQRERVRRYLLASPQLAVQGGYVSLTQVRQKLNISAQSLEMAVQELVRENPHFALLQVKGRRLLQRQGG